jgi:hypothetical protein
MAASGATPIILYHSTTGAAVPSNTNLSPGELAVNIADMKLYCENDSGVVTLLSSADAAAGNFTTVDTTNIQVTNIKAKDGTASITLADSTGVASFTANPVMSGGTANGVTYLNGSKVLTSGSALTFDGTNLGVGANITASATSAPSFTVGTGSGSPAITLYSATNLQSQISFADATTGSGAYDGYLLYDQAAQNMAFGTAATERMRLTSTGLGIGTSSPAQTLHVKTSTSATPITFGVLSNATGLPALSFNGAYASTTMAGIYANGGTSTGLYYMSSNRQ